MSWPFSGLIFIAVALMVFLAYLVAWPFVMGRRRDKMSNIFPRIVSVCFAFTAAETLFSLMSWPGHTELEQVFFPIVVVLSVIGVYAYVLGDKLMEPKVIRWSGIRLAIMLWLLF